MNYFMQLCADTMRPRDFVQEKDPTFIAATEALGAIVGDKGVLSYASDLHKSEGVITLTTNDSKIIDRILESTGIVEREHGQALIGTDCTIDQGAPVNTSELEFHADKIAGLQPA